jgi:hypothetical protein
MTVSDRSRPVPSSVTRGLDAGTYTFSR